MFTRFAGFSMLTHLHAVHFDRGRPLFDDMHQRQRRRPGQSLTDRRSKHAEAPREVEVRVAWPYIMPIEQPRLDSRQFKANPYPVYARLRTEAPVYRAKVAFWLPAIWVVTR